MFDYNEKSNIRVKKAIENGKIPTLEECLDDYNYKLLQKIYKKMEKNEEYFTYEELDLIHFFFDNMEV